MKRVYTLFSSLILVVFSFGVLHAQHMVHGQVLDAEGQPLVGVSVVVEGTETGTITDLDGRFDLRVTELPVNLKLSYTGFKARTVEVTTEQPQPFTLEEGVYLDDVVVVGSRFAPRTSITSAVPIDNIKAEDLMLTGKVGVDQMLTLKVPSYNATQQTISDATAHFDPADLRGLGPSRTLVLVNGKRKNASALVYINDTPGKGEVGVDMKSIPAAAIKRVEVLRDGASAQYGSDAIAGVINIILKDNTDYTDINLFSGITTAGDGLTYGYDVNTGFKLGKNGFINLTSSYSDQKETNRAPSPGTDSLFGNIFGGTLGQQLLDGSHPWLKKHPDMGMHVGTPNMKTADVFANASIDLSDKVQIYAYGGLTLRDGLSYALYRTPYWITTDYGLLHDPDEPYEGFQPTFETDIVDKTLAGGLKGEKNGWQYDLSLTTGSNRVDYTIDQTVNLDMGPQSPTNVKAGGYRFKMSVSNIDLSRKFGMLRLGLGAEFRKENFIAVAGEPASYFGSGVQSFPGLQPQNEVDAVRYNFGKYIDLGLDLTDDWLVDAALRHESYSDFGSNVSYKLASRYKFLDDKLVLRGSFSTGFRAPSLHQIYLSNVQTLVSGGTISNQGTFNNNSPVLRKLGVGKLKDEKARNITAGIAANPAKGLALTFDFYSVRVNDRIVYSSSIATDDTTTQVYQILDENNITSLKFFANAVSTQTTGFDAVINYTVPAGAGKLNLLASANINKTKLVGKVETPRPIAEAHVDLFDRKEQSRILSARPGDKFIIGIGYSISKFRVDLNNTRFGTVTWQHATDPDKDQTFSAKWVTDLSLSYSFNKNWKLTAIVNNLANVYPDPIDTKGDFVTDLGGRFKWPWEVNQFGFNGTTITGNLRYRF